MNHVLNSLFIVIEGADYSGKTTLIKVLKNKLQVNTEINNFFTKIIYTNEPSSEATDVCRTTRSLALDKKDISDFSRALLFFANRSEHISKIIEPALNQGKCLIICDRFYLSTLVYQGEDHPEWLDWIHKTQQLITSIIPNITYVIDIDQQTFTERYRKVHNRNIMDNYAKDKFLLLKRRYIKLATESKDSNLGNIEILPNKPIEQLAEIIEKRIQQEIAK